MHRRIGIVALAVLVVACSSDDGADDAATSQVSTAATSVPTSTEAVTATEDEPIVAVPEGFERVAATVTKADGETCDVCLWLADTPEQRARGLMFVTDLGNTDGMAFVYPGPRTGNFWMKNTLMPLSIAFFGVDGGYLGEFDMEPCTAEPCPRYRTARDFVVAVETNRGELAEIGIGPGSALELTDVPCP